MLFRWQKIATGSIPAPTGTPTTIGTPGVRLFTWCFCVRVVLIWFQVFRISYFLFWLYDIFPRIFTCHASRQKGVNQLQGGLDVMRPLAFQSLRLGASAGLVLTFLAGEWEWQNVVLLCFFFTQDVCVCVLLFFAFFLGDASSLRSVNILLLLYSPLLSASPGWRHSTAYGIVP